MARSADSGSAIIQAGECPGVGFDHDGNEVHCELPLGHGGDHQAYTLFLWEQDDDEDSDGDSA